MANKRLANVKTRHETGFDYVVGLLNIQTPFGKKQLKEMKPFFPGEETALRGELLKTSRILDFIKNDKKTTERIMEIFMEMKDISLTLERSGKSTLSVVEIYELKGMLLLMDRLKGILDGIDDAVLSEFSMADVTKLLNVLDPRGDRLNTFYIYDEFSPKLAGLRSEKREVEKTIRESKKIIKEKIKSEYGITLTPQFDITVSRNNAEQMKTISEIAYLEQSEVDYMSVTFSVKSDAEVNSLQAKLESLNGEIESEEETVQKKLSREIFAFSDTIKTNCSNSGKLDFHMAKAFYAETYDCVVPEIVAEHTIEFKDARHIQVENILREKGKEYCPISVSLQEGVTCITGANMGGKTVSLKLAGFIVILAQYGFFVPCREAKIGLSNYMQLLIGDGQSLERGLSSFGSEMEELKEILDNSRNRSFLLVDEIANGTNPPEATALTKAIVDYLQEKPYITLMTTHFEMGPRKDIVKLQVRGLADADFDLLDREIRYANRKERINVISRYMDYRLCRVTEEEEIPKDALNIAKMLGINADIIQNARNYLAENL